MLVAVAQAHAQPNRTPEPSAGAETAGAGFEVRIDAPQEAREFLLRHLDLLRYRTLTDIDDGELARLVGAAESDTRALLGTLGYFSADVAVQLRTAGAADSTTRLITITVLPGPPTVVAEVTISFTGAITTIEQAAPQRAAIRAAWPLREGMRFTQARWDAAKGQALRLLGAQNFPLGQLALSEAAIDPATRTARLRLTLDSGPAYRIGALRIEGLERFDATLVERIARLRPDSPFDQSALLETQQRLQDSGYFDSVFLSLQTDADPRAAPVLVQLREASRNKLVLGVGASTDGGPRLSVQHTNHQVSGLGWRAVSELLLDRNKRLIGSTLTSPPDAGRWQWVTSVLWKAENVSGVDLQSQNLRLGRSKSEERIDRSYFVDVDRSRTDDSGLVTRARAVGLSYAWTQRNFDSLPFPSRGYGLGAEVGAGVTLGNQRDPYLRALAQWLGVWPLAPGAGRLTARAQGGAVLARDSAVLPSTRLFLTGGDSTVRGYAFHDIGTLSPTGKTVPGRYLLNGSVEWQRPILIDAAPSDWESTLFIDAGTVADRPADFRAKVGIGAGARWKSPVGPLQLDLAYGVATRRVRLHLSVGFTF